MRCWDERPQAFDETEWNLMKEIYIHPKDIDLFVGGLLEKRTPNEGILGPMFGYLVAEQFRRLKDGDRFFFTHEGKHEFLFYDRARKTIKLYVKPGIDFLHK